MKIDGVMVTSSVTFWNILREYRIITREIIATMRKIIIIKRGIMEIMRDSNGRGTWHDPNKSVLSITYTITADRLEHKDEFTTKLQKK